MSTPGVYGFLHNMRNPFPQRIRGRPGMLVVSGTPFDQLLVHSGRRLSDVIGSLAPRVYGAGTKLYLGEGTAAVDSGYSGNPLAMVAFRPERSPEAWLYVADSLRMRKIRADGTLHTVGIEPPLGAPSAVLGPPSYQVISDFTALGSWTSAGTAGAISVVTRYSSTISAILYDSGTTGLVLIAPAAVTSGLRKGMLLDLNTGGGNAETVLVQDVLPSLPQTTIGSIAYDSGTTGLCTIVPAVASISQSQKGFSPRPPGISPTPVSDILVSGPFTYPSGLPPNEQGGPPGPPGQPVGPLRPSSTQPLGLVPGMMILLNSGGGTQEYVRVISVSVGPDGTASFRCSTVNNHAAAETLSGVEAIRTFTVNAHLTTEAIAAKAFQSTVAKGTGYVQLIAAFDLSHAGSPARPIQETDELHISLNLDHPENLTEAQVMLDVDAATNDFAHNFFYAPVRPSDLQPAVVGSITTLQARIQAVARLQGAAPGQQVPSKLLAAERAAIAHARARQNFWPASAAGLSPAGKSGSSQWTEFVVKVSDLIRVGGDSSRGLGNVAGVRIQFQVSGSTVCQAAGFWIGGTYGPDVGEIGSPYYYRSRGRSLKTGAKSLAGPPMRSGVEPHSQQVVVTLVQHPNASVDVLDVFRWGGSLAGWYYVGNVRNTPTPVFDDNLGDADIAANPTLDTDTFQPFPTIDLPRQGTCNVVGTKVIWVSGDVFNTSWYPGSQVEINGVYYTLYAQPSDNHHLEIYENAGTQTAANFSVPQATLLAQPLPSFWGPYTDGSAAFFFGCGDLYQPGVLFITKGNDPDSAPDTLQVEITSPSEPLVNGCMYDGTPFVFSTDGAFRLDPNVVGEVLALGQAQAAFTEPFVPRTLPNAKGLWSRWALAVGPRIWFLSRDGIYETTGGEPQPITAEELYPLFPHEGIPGQAVTIGTVTVSPPDMTQTAALRLSYYDSHLYFGFLDTQGTRRALVWNIYSRVWSVDDYTPRVALFYGDEGQGNHAVVLGGTDGRVYTASGTVDGDGNPFTCEARMPQMSELATAFTVPVDGQLGLISNASVSLILNADGTDRTVVLPSTAGAYTKQYARLPALKAKLLAFGLSSTSSFELFQRDCQFRVGAWGRDGALELVNPFADLRRAETGKVS